MKNAERKAGKGLFLWGIGNNVVQSLRAAAAKLNAKSLPALFSVMPGKPQLKDQRPDEITFWSHWEDDGRSLHAIPDHSLEWSRAHGRPNHFALVCYSDSVIELGPLPIDRQQLRNVPSGKSPAAQQITTLVRELPQADHSHGHYAEGFRAALVPPFALRLAHPRPLTETERNAFEAWTPHASWERLVARLRHTGHWTQKGWVSTD